MRKLLSCGIEVVLSQVHCKEALFRDAQIVSSGALVAPAFVFPPWDTGCKEGDSQSVLSQGYCKEALLRDAQSESSG